MAKRYPQSRVQLIQLESRITKSPYFSRDSLPSNLDNKIFKILEHDHQIPKRESHPNLFHWYVTMGQFSPRERASWGKGQTCIFADDELMRSILGAEDRQIQEQVGGGIGLVKVCSEGRRIQRDGNCGRRAGYQSFDQLDRRDAALELLTVTSEKETESSQACSEDCADAEAF